jgi:hypothetical protein
MVEATGNTERALVILKDCEQHAILEEFGKRTAEEQSAFAA